MRNFIACVAGLNLGWGTLSYISLTIGVLVDGYGFSLTAAGMMASLELSALAAVTLVFGRFVYRFPPGIAAAAGAAVCALANFLTLPDFHPVAIATMRALSGAGAGIVAAVTYAVIGRSNNSVRIIAHSNVVLIIFGAAFFMGMPLLSAHYAYVAYFLAYGAMALACALAVSALNADGFALRSEQAAAAPRPPLTMGSLFILTAAFVMWFGYTAVWSLSERIAAALDMAPMTIGRVLSIATLAGLIGTAIAAAIGERLGHLVPLMTGTVGLAAIYIALTFTDNPQVYSWAMYAFGVALFIVMPYFVGLASARDKSGMLVTQVGATYPLASALAPIIASGLASQHSIRTVGVVAAGATLTCVAALALSARVQNVRRFPDYRPSVDRADSLRQHTRET